VEIFKKTDWALCIRTCYPKKHSSQVNITGIFTNDQDNDGMLINVCSSCWPLLLRCNNIDNNNSNGNNNSDSGEIDSKVEFLRLRRNARVCKERCPGAIASNLELKLNGFLSCRARLWKISLTSREKGQQTRAKNLTKRQRLNLKHGQQVWGKKRLNNSLTLTTLFWFKLRYPLFYILKFYI
jgi:hypothetical protein